MKQCLSGDKKILSSASFKMKRAVTKELELLISDNSKKKENKIELLYCFDF